MRGLAAPVPAGDPSRRRSDEGPRGPPRPDPLPSGARTGRVTAAVQGVYFLLTGLWPLLSMETFLAVTGPKESLWLVRVVGALVIVIGAVLIFGTRHHDPVPEVPALGITAAAAFLIIDLVIVGADIVPWVYLLDAGAQALFLVAWLVALVGRRPARSA